MRPTVMERWRFILYWVTGNSLRMSELNSQEFMTQFTQGILGHAETVSLPDGDPETIRQILVVLQ